METVPGLPEAGGDFTWPAAIPDRRHSQHQCSRRCVAAPASTAGKLAAALTGLAQAPQPQFSRESKTTRFAVCWSILLL